MNFLSSNKPLLLIISLLTLGYPFTITAQVPNEGIANMIIQARQKNSAQLKPYPGPRASN